jgi:CheY-like chemotaxis protein
MFKNLNKKDLQLHIKQTVHDLNNIFSSSLNSAEVLDKLIKGNKKASKLISTIKANTLRAIDITNSLSGKEVKQKNLISLKDVVHDIEYTVKPTLPQRIKLKFLFGKNLKKIYANYTDLYRVLLNLIVNSVESIQQSGTITVAIKNERKTDSVIISVKDTGSGISRDKIKNIFDSGFSTKGKQKNSGYGLSIVKKIIEYHKGSITATSKTDKGTEFLIKLPAVEKTFTKGKKEQIILLADDDKIILELFSDLLSSYNYTVITAENGKKALEKFKAKKPDLIIMDKTMPDIDGLKCIEEIRKTQKDIPIILTTGSAEPIETDFPKLNITKKIKKPFNFEEILSIIQSLII